MSQRRVDLSWTSICRSFRKLPVTRFPHILHEKVNRCRSSDGGFVLRVIDSCAGNSFPVPYFNLALMTIRSQIKMRIWEKRQATIVQSYESAIMTNQWNLVDNKVMLCLFYTNVCRSLQSWVSLWWIAIAKTPRHQGHNLRSSGYMWIPFMSFTWNATE